MKKEITGNKTKRLLKTIAIFIIAAAAFGLLVIAYEATSSRTQSYKDSEKEIDVIAAHLLNKDPNGLTGGDYLAIETLKISELEITNLRPLAKLKYLRTLYLEDACCDLRPLEKLENLRSLDIFGIGMVKNRERPKLLLRLEALLKIPPPKTYEIKLLNISRLNVKNLEHLALKSTGVTNLKYLAKLTNLRKLELSFIPISDIAPLKELKKLKELQLEKCENITDQQIEDLQKALPELKIIK
jgi:Leucine-rich repeat (LRR) protein